MIEKARNFIAMYSLTIKYYLQGDDWGSARKYAGRIVKGFKR